jgi:predicted metal-dependent phosphoesterase TrpH
VTSIADLHLHTTASDGRLSPTQLINLVSEKGLQIVSITDHDSTAGLHEAFEAASFFPSLTIIPGIELGTDIPGSEVHLLGHWINYNQTGFQETLSRFRDSRQDRARAMVKKLGLLGLPLEWSRVESIAQGGAIGRPHIAYAMVEKGYIRQPQDAFDKYLGRNGLAYAEREKLTPEEAIRLLLDVGGIPTLAHPREVFGLTEVLPGLVKAGLMGIEVYYKDYPDDEVERLGALAKKFGLLALGGTDYHAFGTPLEIEPGAAGPPNREVEQLLELAHHQR